MEKEEIKEIDIKFCFRNTLIVKDFIGQYFRIHKGNGFVII